MGRRRVTRYNDTIGPELSSGMLVLTIFLAAVIVLSVYFVCNREPDAYGDELTDDTQESEAVDETDGNVDDGRYDLISVPTEDTARGFLILVNGKTAYNFDIEEKIVSLYMNEEKSSSYGLATSGISTAQSVLGYFNTMIEAYYADTEDSKTVINSGYRSYEDQAEILQSRIDSVGEEQAYDYVARPGHSEHHTGYAFDVVSYGENADGTWLPNHCCEYGFIQRYRADKEALTGIKYEYWHYRYVGAPHAEIMMRENYCMEEYIELVGKCTYDAPLSYTDASGASYAVYTVAASDGELTEIPVPKGAEYSISGNNVGGFIVTVKTGTAAEKKGD